MAFWAPNFQRMGKHLVISAHLQPMVMACCRQAVRRHSSSLSAAVGTAGTSRGVQRRSSSYFLRASLAIIPYDGARASILTAPSQGIPTLQVSYDSTPGRPWPKSCWSHAPSLAGVLDFENTFCSTQAHFDLGKARCSKHCHTRSLTLPLLGKACNSSQDGSTPSATIIQHLVAGWIYGLECEMRPSLAVRML